MMQTNLESSNLNDRTSYNDIVEGAGTLPSEPPHTKKNTMVCRMQTNLESSNSNDITS